MSIEHPRFDTLQAHAGHVPDPVTGSRAVPIYQTTSFVFEDAQYAADLFALKREGHAYSRISNPTNDIFEKRMAALENGSGALAYSSGMSAIAQAVFNLAKAGDEIISANTLYGGTHTLFTERLPGQFGIGVKLIDIDDLSALESAISHRTKAVFIETLGNPVMNIPDFEAVAAVAHAHGLPLICDNTFGTPYLFRCADWGVDISVHSATKYIGGHGAAIAGVTVDMGSFNWKDNPRFPDFNCPDETNHGIVYAEQGASAFITKARVQGMRDLGTCLSPFNAFLLLIGLETLSLRVERHCRNAEKIARFLNSHPHVGWVNYPALEGDKYYDRYKKYMPGGVGGIMAFGVKGGKEAAARAIGRFKIISHLANVADAKTLAIHPASTTHSQMSDDALMKSGIAPEMIRLSVGLEDADDLMEDLDRALSGC